MARRSKGRPREATARPAVTPPPLGGRYRPLDALGLSRIVQAAMDILSATGIGECPKDIAERMVAAGATRRADNRICFPQTMVETAIARAAQRGDLPGFVDTLGLTIGGGHVHIGTGGAATEILDSATGGFRGVQLADLYDLMRLVGQRPNVHYGLRLVIARDMDQPFLLDLNTG